MMSFKGLALLCIVKSCVRVGGSLRRSTEVHSIALRLMPEIVSSGNVVFLELPHK